MPLYAFHCGKCGKDFELFQRPSESVRGVSCISCGEQIPREGRESAVDDPVPVSAPVCGLPQGT